MSFYDTDFVRWAEQQTALLRERRFNALDLDHLIEGVGVFICAMSIGPFSRAFSAFAYAMPQATLAPRSAPHRAASADDRDR